MLSQDIISLSTHLLTSRLLRGGSGGGGGGGGGGSSVGGGGSYGGGGGLFWGGGRGSGTNTYGSDPDCDEDDFDCDEDDPVFAIGAFLGIILSVLCCGCLCFYYIRKKNANFGNNIKPGSDAHFDEAVSEARRGIAYKSSSGGTDNDTKFHTYSALFHTKYTDRNKTLTGVLNINLENDGFSGYTICGSGSDTDGGTNITDGFVTYSGNAWWLEETTSGPDVGLKILSEGKFNFGSNSFTGTWRSNTKCKGNYVSFLGSNVETTSLAPSTMSGALDQGIPVVQATTNDADIPVAFAQEEAPTVVGTPEPAVPYAFGK